MNRVVQVFVVGVALGGATPGGAEPPATLPAPSSVAGARPYLLLAQAAPSAQEHVKELREWLQASQAKLRGYEWIETITASQDGEEQSRRQNSCYFGVDGRLQRVPLPGATEEAAGGGPLRKRVAAHEKQELEAYMQSAAGLAHAYVPPDPQRLQQLVEAGKLSVAMTDPGRRVRLDFHDYLKAGDLLSVDVELPSNRLLGLHVASYLDSPSDAVELDVGMGVLPDGTIYMQRTTLDAKAKRETVTIENSGYRPAAR